MKKEFLFTVFTLFIFIISIICGPGCANIIPPSGGPRDSIPPVLVSASPKDSTVNFKSKSITLTFNEFIDLKEVQNNLLFTPIFENVPVIEARLRTLTIKIRDTLEPNTTYNFNFGQAIQDVNEGNPVKNFVYTFSTGPVLDSLEIRGKVILAETGKIDSTLIVVLHKSMDDSAIVKQRPRYVARLDSAGNFRFRSLPKDTFAIYAIGDAGLSRRYTSPTQAFAFANAPVVAGADSLFTLYAYKEEAEEEKKKTPAATKGGGAAEKRLRFTSNLESNQQDLLKNLTLTFERPLRSFDSTKMRLTTDSTFTPVAQYRLGLDSTQKILTLQTQWKEATEYNLVIQKDFAEDTLGRKLLKDDTLSFTTRKRSDYGNLRIRIRNVDTASNPVLQFIQNDKVVFSASVKSGVFTQALFPPGEYELRMLSDTNNNSKWDPGQFFGPKKKQPEIARPIQKKLTVKPNWDNELEITAP
ncbi:Ig-like domain-containing protein [Chitinophagaceae bacterium LB-8]|uniref:Ig-like domain-containing protein n=1 Tax=Paraflavisolibacter caeni TaxID=2982496 RepID=A0A9X2XSJ0_9BACT|nr:Ig-like domain-containing protein [Paraflavisolibacter caeni]MCU7547527.1 Ig-like domain-containing protein [Paraflavisolibacter caeni]